MLTMLGCRSRAASWASRRNRSATAASAVSDGWRTLIATSRSSPRSRARYTRPNPPVPISSSRDRKSTRLNSSHSQISYAVFCLQKEVVTHGQHRVPAERRLAGAGQRYDPGPGHLGALEALVDPEPEHDRVPVRQAAAELVERLRHPLVRHPPVTERLGVAGLRRLVGELLFFSSRRRHTRFDCDWSSDVCSSD